jgi:hypothetical protein
MKWQEELGRDGRATVYHQAPGIQELRQVWPWQRP